MATVVVMPQLGNSVESCLIVSWSVREGDTVEENTVLCEVETDKAAMEVPSTVAGTVLKLLWSEGDDVPVKEPLLVVGEPGEDVEAALDEADQKDPQLTEVDTPEEPAGEKGYEETEEGAPDKSEPVDTMDVDDPTDSSPDDQAVSDGPTAGQARGVSPRARNLAASRSLDPASVGEGTGPGGRVIERDVQATLEATTHAAARAGVDGAAGGTGLGGRTSTADLAAATAEPAETPAATQAPVSVDADFPGPVTTTPVKGIRKVISERMMQSLASSAQLTYHTSASAEGLLAMRRRLKESDPALELNGVTIGDLVGYAAVKVVARHAGHNAHLEDGVLTTFERVHLGFACDTPRGLLVPTVRNASQMSLGEFSRVSKQLAAEALDGSISPDLLSGATFTVSNLGGMGVEAFTPLLNVPQTAILGVSAIVPRATEDDKGKVRLEKRIGLSLTADHRAVDGADSARFLADLVAFLERIDLAVLV